MIRAQKSGFGLILEQIVALVGHTCCIGLFTFTRYERNRTAEKNKEASDVRRDSMDDWRWWYIAPEGEAVWGQIKELSIGVNI